MYEIVRTKKQQVQFQKTWEFFCQKYGWMNDPYASDGIRYNMFLPRKHLFNSKQVIGTVEFIPYDPANPNSTVVGRSHFTQQSEIIANQNRVWEIDKICIHEHYQRQGHFLTILHIFYDHALKHEPKYYIGLMEQRFFRMVRIAFGVAVEQKEDAFIGPTTSLVPVCLDIEAIMNDPQTLKRLLKIKGEVHFSASRKQEFTRV